MQRSIAIWILLLVIGMGSSASLARVEEHGAAFLETIKQDDQPLQLMGTGIVRYRVIFIVYAAGLYLPADTVSADVLAANTPRRLEIEYFHDINKSDIILAANTKLSEQLDATTLARLQPKIDRFHALFQSVGKGDRYRMDYTPGTGTQLRFNGEPVGTVEGEDFAAAYYGIWLDAENPLSQSLRRNLLDGVE